MTHLKNDNDMKTYIVAAKRTAIGKFLGSTLHIPVSEMAAKVNPSHNQGKRS